jgi:hypothetical protein
MFELLGRQNGAGAPRSWERRTSFFRDLVQEDSRVVREQNSGSPNPATSTASPSAVPFALRATPPVSPIDWARSRRA